MPWPFDREYMQLALAAGLVVGACAPLIGTFLVQKRMSLIGDGIGHIAFAGVAAGLLLDVWPYWTALAVSVLGALAIERLRARGQASGDLILATFFYGGIAAGVVLVGLGGSLDANLLSFLFGSILTVTAADVWTVVIIGAVIVLAIATLGRALFAVASDEEWARTTGIPVGALNAVLAVLTAVTIVAAMRVVGVLLIAALMVLPVGVGQQVARSFRGALAWAAGVGVIAVVLGLAAARQWGLAPGGSIVLVAAAFFALASLLGGRRRGPVSLMAGPDGGPARSPAEGGDGTRT
jgi:zinc transport system permease protein